MWNQLKTILLLGVIAAIAVGLGALFGGRSGLYVALGFALLFNLAMYFWSDKLVLWSYKAKEADKDAHRELRDMVARVARQAGIPAPRVYLIQDASPNAFATGRNPKHAAVAYTEGIVRLLSAEELEGVTAHELAHVRNRDILIMTIAAVFASMISWVGHIFAFGGDDDGPNLLGIVIGLVVAPFVAMLLQLAISRTREFHADETGARITRKPRSLASALERLERGIANQPMPAAGDATASLFIANPFGPTRSKKKGFRVSTLFMTHPPMDERIERLKKLRL